MSHIQIPNRGSGRIYKVYTALLTQTGTNAPVATVLENTLGGTVVWSYNSAGLYDATATGLFTLNKTWISIANGTQFDSTPFSTIYYTNLTVNDFSLNTVDGTGTLVDWVNMVYPYVTIEIRVYP